MLYKDILYNPDLELPSYLCAEPAYDFKINKLLWSQDDSTEQLVLYTSIEMFIKLPV